MESRSYRITIKMLIGFILTRLMPQKTQRIKKSFALQYWGRGIGKNKISKRMESVIRFYLAHATKNRDDELEKIHKHFWERQINLNWYEKSQQRFESSTLPVLEPHVKTLKAILENTHISTVCEIGTGDGMFLNHLRQTLHSPTNFIGLDLSAERIAFNSHQFPGLHFFAGDVFEWINHTSTDNTLYVTNGGVFEYSSQKTLTAFFNKIKLQQPGSIIALFHESLALDHKLSTDNESRLTCGGEFSFSHNFPFLFKQAEFRVQHLEEENHPAGYRALTIIASSSNLVNQSKVKKEAVDLQPVNAI
ncbi:MAG: class I SAM-dependent methyltransferase [Pseudomonadota bacterium]